MDAEFFIHGPRNAFYGKQEENRYCQLFDNSQIKDEIRFVVDVRNGGGNKLYTYYTYCRYSNILDIDGRSGAYIGLTVRLDVYYSNLRNIFTVLDATFNTKVVGLLVKKFGEGYQYLISDFRNSKQSIASNVERCVGTMLMGIISQGEIYPIDATFNIGGCEIIKGLDDNKFSELRLEDIRKCGKLVFSSSKDIDLIDCLKSDFERERQNLLTEKEKVIAGLRSSLDTLSNENNRFSAELSQKDSIIASLEYEKLTLESDAAKREQEISDLKHQLCNQTSNCGNLGKPQNENYSAQKTKKRSQMVDYSVSHTSDRSSDCDNIYGKREQRPKRNSKSWEEELKIGITAFFLVAVGSCAFLTIKHFATDKKTGKIDEAITLENNTNERAKVLVLPNELTDKIYSDCTSSEKLSKKLTAKAIQPHGSATSIWRLKLSEPEVNVHPFIWLIKDLAGQQCLLVSTNSTTIEYTPKENGKYIVQVFARDTLITMRLFDL